MPRLLQPKLTSQDWIKAGFRALTREGVSGLKAETLARTLKSTKGSFYWHFKDVSAFKRNMLKLWQAEATSAIIRHVDSIGGSAPDRLTTLIETVSSISADNEYGGLQAEPAIRSWAQNDKVAMRTLCLVDAERIAFVKGLFFSHGHSNEDANSSANVFYASLLGMQSLAASREFDVGKHLKQVLALLLENRT